MPHGSPPRSAHRAPEGGLAVLVTTSGKPGVRPGPGPRSAPTRQRRQPPPHRAPREPHRPMQLLMSALGTVIMLALCGLSGFFVVAAERRGHGAETDATAEQDI